MIDAQLYRPIFFSVVTVLCFAKVLPTSISMESPNGSRFAFVLVMFIGVFIGLRPVSEVFVDMPNYDRGYYLYQYLWHSDSLLENLRHPTEFGFQLLSVLTAVFCKDSTLFFLVIAVGYFSSMYATTLKLSPNYSYMGVLFQLSCMSVFAYAVNTIRGGLACALLLYVFALLLRDRHNKYAYLLTFVAFIIHSSVLLPIAIFLLLLKYEISIEKVLFIWIASIVVSLLIGSAFSNYMDSIEFLGDRFSDYNTTDTEYKIGFRWDFLIYSAIPIFSSYYLYLKYNISDSRFRMIFNTYVLCNAFWILVIRMAFTNRVAYLSWFMYGLLLFLAGDSVPNERIRENIQKVLLLMNLSITLLII